MAVVGTPRSYHKRFSFKAEFERVTSAFFKSVSEIKASVAVVEQWEGGRLIPDKSPGRVTVEDVTCERGAAKGDSDLYDWWLDVVRISANTGLIDGLYKRDGDMIQMDRNGRTTRRWLLDNAWPREFSAGSWDNDADENVIEMMVLAYDAPELTQDN